MLKHIIKVLLAMVIVVVLYMIGCSQTYFSSLKAVSCEDVEESLNINANCGRVSPPRVNLRPEDPEKNFLEFRYEVPLGEVDIVFVIDNSSSMHKEHTSLARQFEGFLSEIRNIKYRIAVITTDISSSPNNPVRGQYYQDGRFIPIGGRMYLENTRFGRSPSSRDVQDFIKAIVRPETLACDSKNKGTSFSSRDDDYYFTHGQERSTNTQVSKSSPCPSHDERGIYALNLAVENHRQREFFRGGAHFMAVILSDEDERSSASFASDRAEDGEDYRLEARDYPEVLSETIYSQLGPLKSFSAHSIIIKDKRCLNRQYQGASAGSGSGRGYLGVEYQRLSEADDPAILKYENILRGSAISICDRDYGSQLGRVAVYAGVLRASLPCSNPESISVIVNDRKARVSHKVEGKTLIIGAGEVRLGSKVELSVVCEE